MKIPQFVLLRALFLRHCLLHPGSLINPVHQTSSVQKLSCLLLTAKYSFPNYSSFSLSSVSLLLSLALTCPTFTLLQPLTHTFTLVYIHLSFLPQSQGTRTQMNRRPLLPHHSVKGCDGQYKKIYIYILDTV